MKCHTYFTPGILAASLLFFLFFAINKTISNSLWADEFYMLIVSEMDFLKSLAQTTDYSAPLYQLVLKPIVASAGTGHLALRLPAMVFSIIGLMYFLVLMKDLFDFETACFATALIAVNPLFIHNAAEARPYTLLFCTTCASYYYYLLSTKSPGTLRGALYTLSSFAMVISHYYGYLVLASQFFHFAYLSILNKSWKTPFTRFFALAIALATIALALPLRYLLEGAPAASWMDRPAPYSWYLGDLFHNGKIGALVCAAFVISLLALFSQKLLPKPAEGDRHFPVARTDLVALLLWTVLGFYSILLITIVVKPIYTARHFVFILAPAVALLFFGISRLPRKAAILVSCALFFIQIHSSSRELFSTRHDFTSTVALLNTEKPGCVFVPYSPYGTHYANPIHRGLLYYGYESASLARYDELGARPEVLRPGCKLVVFGKITKITKILEDKGIGFGTTTFGNMSVIAIL